jgi:beta-lactamase family protein
VRRLAGAAVVAAALAAAGPAPAARAGDVQLLRAVRGELPRAERAAAVQEQYDSARDLELALGRALPVSPGCERLRQAALAFARGRIESAEGIDRLRDALVATGDRRARRARTQLARLGRTCRAGRPVAGPATPELQPRSYAVSFGSVLAPFTGPSVLRANGRIVGRSSTGRFHPGLTAGRYDLEVRGPGSRVARSDAVWLLPPAQAKAHAPLAQNPELRGKLGSIGTAFPGVASFSVRNLVTGRTAGWNSDARFPAASTVKLGVIAAAIDRLGTGPRTLPELRAIAGWSSNLAANRLVSLLGGTEPVRAALRRLGAASSTYPGQYRVGTARSDVIRQPPIVSFRLTTANDLTSVMATLHAAATGDRRALRRSRLSVSEARLAIGLLLASERNGDNAGLLRGALPTLPIAQKQGWISSARHTTAIVYGPRGPVAVTILLYRPGITLREAQAVGASVARLLDLV